MSSIYCLRVQNNAPLGWYVHDIRSSQAYECKELPDNIRERIALLMMFNEDDAIVSDVGYRFNNSVFYLNPDTL
jgi:hypothetical protein